jgi:hypothetical protein
MSTQAIKGKTLQAMEVSEHEAVGSASLNELEHFGVKSPSDMAQMKIGKSTEKPLADAKELRLIVQRTWDKARHARADLYKQYLLNLTRGTIIGATPPVTVYVDQQGKINGGGVIQFPYTATAIAVDGETQLEARFRLREELPETGDTPFAVTLHHGTPEEHGIQILHDYNRYANPIPESKLGSKNSTGGMSVTIYGGIAQSKTLQVVDDLNRTGAAGTKKHTASFRQAMSYVASFGVGLDALKRNATSWFDAFNSPGAPPINGKASAYLAELFDMAAADKRISMAAPILWQVAGVLGAEGRTPSSLNWDEGFAAYIATAPKTLGKSKISDRLEALYAALK